MWMYMLLGACVGPSPLRYPLSLSLKGVLLYADVCMVIIICVYVYWCISIRVHIWICMNNHVYMFMFVYLRIRSSATALRTRSMRSRPVTGDSELYRCGPDSYAIWRSPPGTIRMSVPVCVVNIKRQFGSKNRVISSECSPLCFLYLLMPVLFTC